MTVQASDLVIKTFSNKDDITRYIENEVGPKMGVWRPRGVVLHNTGSPTLAQFNRGPHGPITDRQRILNSIPDWQKRGFSGCPHGFVMPGRFTTANPFWKKGTHSPSWNGTFWGIEMGGDFDAEAFPPETLDFATHVLACLYSLLGVEPGNASFHLHKEDPNTTHKHCPGKNAGDKVEWLNRITERMRFLHPGELSHDAPAHEEPKQTKATVDVPAHDFLMLRKAAGAAAQLVNPLPPGTLVTVIGDASQAWVNVQTELGVGWVASRYLKIST
jgi:hypothetical protein